MTKPPKPRLNKIHDIGINIYPDKKDSDPNLGSNEDFYSSDLDDSDDKYVNDNFREGDKSTDAVLCCAMCFTPVCYQCKRVGNSFLSKSALNVYIDESSLDSSCKEGDQDLLDKPDSNKRKIEKNDKDLNKIAKCIECNNTIAILDKYNNYIFKDVIASQP